MADIKSYERKKRRALIELAFISIVFLGLWFYIVGNQSSLEPLIPIIMLWAYFLVKYEQLSTKIDIFKEMQDKKEETKAQKDN